MHTLNWPITPGVFKLIFDKDTNLLVVGLLDTNNYRVDSYAVTGQYSSVGGGGLPVACEAFYYDSSGFCIFNYTEASFYSTNMPLPSYFFNITPTFNSSNATNNNNIELVKSYCMVFENQYCTIFCKYSCAICNQDGQCLVCRSYFVFNDNL